jgi:hypothetical protein
MDSTLPGEVVSLKCEKAGCDSRGSECESHPQMVKEIAFAVGLKFF